MDLVATLRDIVGDRGIVDRVDSEPYLKDRRGYYQGSALCIVQPSDTSQVVKVVNACRAVDKAIVPQGGNTGLCGGATPDTSGDQVLLSLSRMNAIRDIDPANFTITVEAGVILQRIQETAAEHDLLYPLDLTAKGTCQIGGNLSTNAGGVNVLRYGNARDLVLGLEVVLPDGNVWNGLSKLRKDNTGYDLTQLFVGAEGTLGIITAAVLKLFSLPADRHTAFIAVKDVAAACRLQNAARRLSGDSMSSFEYLTGLAVELVQIDPLQSRYQHYVLLELVCGKSDNSGQQQLEAILTKGMETGDVLDGTIAQSGKQRALFWQLRESISAAQYESVKNDISVPISTIPELLESAALTTQKIAPEARPCPFGHIGDGNIHYNILGPADLDPIKFREQYGSALVEAINELVMSRGGSFSAEHGVGVLRREALSKYKDPVEVELMQFVKSAIDPGNTMNPGKILSSNG